MEHILSEINNHKSILDILNQKYLNTIDINEKNFFNNEMQNERKILITLYNIYFNGSLYKQDKQDNNNEIQKEIINEKKPEHTSDKSSNINNLKINKTNTNKNNKVKKRTYTYDKKNTKNKTYIIIENIDPIKNNNFIYIILKN